MAALELNVSCPNVETGLVMGADPGEVARLMSAVRPLTDKPLIVKLTPNASDVPAVAIAAEREGASAVSLINTIRGMAVHPRTGEPWLGGTTGGVSGPAVRAIALAQVRSVADAVRSRSSGWAGSRTGAMPTSSDRRRRHACGSRHRELPGPVGGRADRRRVSARGRCAPPFRAGAGRPPALIRTHAGIGSKNPLQTEPKSATRLDNAEPQAELESNWGIWA